MVAIFFISPFFLGLALFLTLKRGGGYQYALDEAIFFSVILWMACIILVSEILSLVNGLQFLPVTLVWSFINIILGYWVFKRKALLFNRNIPLNLRWDPLVIFFLLLIVLILGLAGIMAVLAPPNTPDAISYHLPRQIYWIQQGSLDHFFTKNDRQIMMPPLSEIVGMHLMLMSKGDQLANLPQWFAYVLSTLAAARIAKELKAPVYGQILAGLLVVTIPIGFHQASSAKNDMMTALLLLMLAWQSVRYIRAGETNWWDWVLLGCNLGLVWLVKGTGLVYSVPIMIFIGIRMLARMKMKIWQPVVTIALVAFFLCNGHYIRNYLWYGSVFGTIDRPGYDLIVENYSPKSFLSNLLRNVSLHMGTPTESWNRGLYDLLQAIHTTLDIDINDPQTTYWARRFKFNVEYRPGDENAASAPGHLLLILIAPFLMLLRANRKWVYWLYYYVIPGFGLVLFCFFIKWQPWHTRLHLPLFCLSIPIVATILANGRLGRPLTFLTAVFTFFIFMPALYSHSRPVFNTNNIFNLSRTDLQYRIYPNLKAPEQIIFDFIRQLKPACVKFDMEWGEPYRLQRRIVDHIHPPPHFWGQTPLESHPAPDLVVAWGNGRGEAYRPSTLRSEAMTAVGQIQPFILYIPDTWVKAHGLASDPPNLIGWKNEEGLTQGLAYSSFSAAPGRVMRGRKALLKFDGTGEAFKLTAWLYTLHPTKAPFRIQCNGEILFQHNLNPPGIKNRIQLDLPTQKGTNAITFDFPTGMQTGRKGPGILFTKLQILRP